MHTLYESDTTKHSGIPGPLEGSSFNRKVSVAWNVTQQSFIHYITLSLCSGNFKAHRKPGCKAVKPDAGSEDPPDPPYAEAMITTREMSFIFTFHSHMHAVRGVCCLPGPICCAGLRPGPANRHHSNGEQSVQPPYPQTILWHNGISCPCCFTCMLTFSVGCTDSAQIFHTHTFVCTVRVTYYTLSAHTSATWTHTRTHTHVQTQALGCSKGPTLHGLIDAASIYSECLFPFSAVHLYASRDLGSEWASMAVLLSIEAAGPDNMDGREPQTEGSGMRVLLG